MLNGIVTSLSGVANALRRTNITANNIANAQTPEFQAARAANVEQPQGGVRIGAVRQDDSPGPPLPEDLNAAAPRRGANVDLATEQVNLLINQRQFEANLNALRTQDETLEDFLDING